MKILDIRKFKIQGDRYRLEISEDDHGFFYKIFKNDKPFAMSRKYINALRVIITSYEIPSIRGRRYFMEGFNYQIIPLEDNCICNYINAWDLDKYQSCVFPDEWHCINWILCGFHDRDL